MATLPRFTIPRRGPRAPAPTPARPRAQFVNPWALSTLTREALVSRSLFLGTVLVVLLVGATTTVLAVKWRDRPFAGFLVNERMVIGNIGQYHWTGVQAGLTWPDRIVAADGRPVSSLRDLEAVVRAKPLGDAVAYSVERGGRTVELTIPTMRFTWLDVFMTFGITLLSGLGYVLTGVVVFLLKPDARVSWAFLIASVSLGLFSITSFDIQSTHAGFIRIYLLVNALFPAAFFHLALLFPEPWPIVRRRPVVQVAPYAVAALLILPVEALYPRPAFLAVYQFVRAYAMVGALMMLASTLRAYFTSASSLARQRAKVVLFGAALAFPLPAGAYYASLFGGNLLPVSIQNNFLALPILIFPVAVAYAIARHNLFDVDVYIKRALGYGVMTVIVGVTYWVLQFGTKTLILQPLLGDASDQALPMLFAVLVVFLFNPVNRRVQGTVDRLFFRAALDYKGTIRAVSNALTSMLDFDQIVSRVLETVRKEMAVDSAGVIVLEPEQQRCRARFLGGGAPEAGARADAREVPVGYDDPLLALVCQERTLVTRYDLEEDARFGDVREAGLRRFGEMGASMAIPFMYQGTVTGMLALGHKKSGHFYGRDDIDLLTTLADQAAVAIENATTHEEVVRYAEELATSLRRIQLLESIKSNLAKFVPKTVQDLIEQSPEAPLFDKREVDVSVVFADITGYTRLSAQMELEQVNKLVERYFGAFLDEILKQGGDVNETAGDGLMVIFQDPDPRAHARAAARAALGIRRRTLEINEELRGQSEPITMHVGVNSGTASVGATKIEGAAGTRWTYTASGPTTNVAARLSALAQGGSVVVSEETHRRLGDDFEAEDLGPQSLKNVAQPVRVYRLEGENGGRAATAVAPASETERPPA